jgi:hypothetical protein
MEIENCREVCSRRRMQWSHYGYLLIPCISIMHAMEFGLKLGAKSGGSKIIIIVLLEQVLI